MGSNHTDKLIKSFISGSSNPLTPYDAFSDLQDPTFLSFKIDFFPDMGSSIPDDQYSSGGLFRKKVDQLDYTFFDSAADYLYRIGSPARQHYLEIFANLLYNIQTKAPWYFQSITGLSDLYKIDPAVNFRGKDKVLTIECLESIDLRLSLLADTYRNLAFDMQNMREVLPINLRTFNMTVHVLEFRKFNTTFGIIADTLAKNGRSTMGQNRQVDEIQARRKNVFSNNNSTLFSGTFNAAADFLTNANSQLGGIFSNTGSISGPNIGSIKSAFEAISIQSFVLKDCEFDFFSEAPGYLDNVSVKEIPEATHKFKVKVGKIQKTAYYAFDNYVISEFAKFSKINPADIKQSALGRSFNSSPEYFEETPYDSVDNPPSDPYSTFRDKRESIFPTEGNPTSAQADAYAKALEDSAYLRKKPLERLLGGVIRNATRLANTSINNEIGEATGGVLGTSPLGNIYGDPAFIRGAANALNDFLTPGSQLGTNNVSAKPPTEILQNIKFETLKLVGFDNHTVGFEKPPPSVFEDSNVFGKVVSDSKPPTNLNRG